MQSGLEVTANRFGKKLDADLSIMNLNLPDGSRVAAMIPPVVNPRPLMTIRKFTSRNFTVADPYHEADVDRRAGGDAQLTPDTIPLSLDLSAMARPPEQ